MLIANTIGSRLGRRRQSTALIVAAVLVANPVSRSADAAVCKEPNVGTVVPAEEGLRVEQTDVVALRAGDVLMQLNGRRLQTCADLTAGLGEARRKNLATLFLIRRDGTVSVALVPVPGSGAVAAAPVAVAPAPVPAAQVVPHEPAAQTAHIEAIAPPAPTEALRKVEAALPTAVPSPAVPTTPPTPLSRADADATRHLLADLEAFGRDLQARQPLPKAQPWAQRVQAFRQEYNAQRAGGAAVSVAEPILAYYETVTQILLYKERLTQERRDVRAKSEIVLEYHGNSEVTTWLERYPFLHASVIEEPEVIRLIGVGESNGQWMPDRAVSLLLDRAVSEGSALSATLAAG